MKKIIMFLLLLCPVLVQTKKKSDRGIVKSVFVLRGQWFMSSTVSYSEQSTDQYQFLVLANIDAKGYTFRLSPLGEYFFANSMAAGDRFAYSRTYFNIGNVNINLGDDLSFHVKDDMYLGRSYSASGFLHTCMGLGSGKAFGSSSEVCLTYACGQGKCSNSTGNDPMGYYQHSHTFKIGTASGLTAFVPNFTSVEVPVGVAGFSYK